ncbi:MAG: hypothetical protein ABIG71_00565 [Candidatus Uhrbacteria bacterium]
MALLAGLWMLFEALLWVGGWILAGLIPGLLYIVIDGFVNSVFPMPNPPLNYMGRLLEWVQRHNGIRMLLWLGFCGKLMLVIGVFEKLVQMCAYFFRLISGKR